MISTKKPETLLTDLDGTLLKIDVDWDRVRIQMARFFSKLGVTLYFRPILEKIEDALDQLRVKDPTIDLFQTRYNALEIIKQADIDGAQRAMLIDGVLPTLEFIHHKGIPMGIFSRNTKDCVMIALRTCNILGMFKAILGRKEGINCKPHPDHVRILCARMGTSPKVSWVVGDHPYDIISGKKAGAYTIGVLTGYCSQEDLERASADLILDSFGEISDLL